MRGEGEPVLPLFPLLIDDAQPERLEAPAPLLAADRDSLDIERGPGQPHILALACAAVGKAESEIDERDIEAEKARDRPSAGQDETKASAEAGASQHHHHPEEPSGREAAMRMERRIKKYRIGRRVRHGQSLGRFMAL